MRRTLTTLFLGSALSFLFAFGGHRLIYSLVSGTGGSYKDDWITIQLIETFIIFPLLSLVVGIVVGWLQQRWWLAGVCLIPLFGYLLWYLGGEVVILKLGLIYAVISSGVAMIVWRLRRRAHGADAQLKEQV